VGAGARLPRSFYARRATEVAPDLLGRVLVRVLADGERLAARIVETEAYEPDDPASHAFRGMTARNAVMFGPPGHLYVYFSYGMHFCMNAVTEERGAGAAVLLRAGEAIEGLERMAAHRGLDDRRRLCSGPARLAQAFAVARGQDGVDLATGDEGLWIATGTPVGSRDIVAGPRVGIRAARDLAWRFRIRDDPFVSPGRAARIPASPPEAPLSTR
jgi:DNA-3-methyladenine glycosylase